MTCAGCGLELAKQKMGEHQRRAHGQKVEAKLPTPDIDLAAQGMKAKAQGGLIVVTEDSRDYL